MIFQDNGNSAIFKYEDFFRMNETIGTGLAGFSFSHQIGHSGFNH
jgi:hypothetical protein